MNDLDGMANVSVTSFFRFGQESVKEVVIFSACIAHSLRLAHSLHPVAGARAGAPGCLSAAVGAGLCGKKHFNGLS